MKYFIIFLITIIIVVVIAVSKTEKSNSNLTDQYLEKTDRTVNTHQITDVEKIFLKLFKDFKIGANEQVIRQTYAENFYFNDTLKVLTNIDELVSYMTHAAEMVKSTTVEILDTAYSGSDYYIRWVMVMEFNAQRKDVYSKSVGMTQLRFNQDGKIIFHHDFWDSTEGFYQHLPYIGYVIRKVRSQL